MADILIDRANAIQTITINRPDKKNALTSAMYAELAVALYEADQDSSIRATLITGAGGTFTAGNDLNDFLNNPPRGDDTPVARFLRALATIEKPLVAAVSGVAVGIGTTMLLHCDLVYAGVSARLQLPFVNLALVPEAASSLLLPRLVGHQKAAELFFFGEAFDAKTGQEIGLVNGVFPDETLLAEARARVLKLTLKAPTALRMTKKLMRQGYRASMLDQMAAESVDFGHQLSSSEAREAMTAFFEKRAPVFK